MKQQFPGYEVQQHNSIIDALGGWSREMDTTMHEIVGSRSREVLRKMQKAVLSGTLNIAQHCSTLTNLENSVILCSLRMVEILDFRF